jgi:signal transduction histidine kinase
MQKNFISAVSHELKSPLFVITGYIEMLTNLLPAKASKELGYAGVISEEAEKMNTMLRTLLDLSQLESGLFKVKRQYFALDTLCLDIARRYAPLLQSRHIKLITKLNSLTINTDIERLEQIITNYLNNALEHSKGSEPIELWALTTGEGHFKIAVYNGGTLIDTANSQKIWQPFYKVDGARPRDIGGSGLGLSIVVAISGALNYKFGSENYENGVLFWIEGELDSKTS